MLRVLRCYCSLALDPLLSLIGRRKWRKGSFPFSLCSHVQKNKSWRNSLWCTVEMPWLWVNRCQRGSRGHSIRWLKKECGSVLTDLRVLQLSVHRHRETCMFHIKVIQDQETCAVLEQISCLMFLSHLPLAEFICYIWTVMSTSLGSEAYVVKMWRFSAWSLATTSLHKCQLSLQVDPM